MRPATDGPAIEWRPGRGADRRRRCWSAPSGCPPASPRRWGAALFGASAVALLGSGLMQVAFGLTDGTGALLSAGTVSLLASVVFGLWLVRSLTGPSAGPV